MSGSRLRVLHIITTGQRRGAEMFASDLIRALNVQDVEQRVAVMYGVPPLPAGFEAPTTVLATERPEPRHTLPVDRALGMRLRRVIRSWRPDVVQAHGGEPFAYAAAFASPTQRIVFRRIGLAPVGAKRGSARSVYRLLMRRARRIVAVAEAVRRETIDGFGIPPARVITIPRGVDPSRILSDETRLQARRALDIAPDAPVILSLGALSEEKDPIAHLAVLDRVRRDLPDAVHLIAGDGPLRGEIERRAGAGGLNGLARILGNRSDVGRLLASADVILLASRVEGMPGCLIEAGMAGVPAVSYDVAGAAEVVDDGTTGYLARAGDVAGLASHAVQLLQDESLRQRMGTAARDRCGEAFAIDAIAPRYLAIYREVSS
jgi:glycosyltransferase involved in cell wall biosynthesis